MACPECCKRPCFYCEGTQLDGHVCDHCRREHHWPKCSQADDLKSAAALLGRKGGAVGTGVSKRRAVDYAELGRKGGASGKGKKKPRKKRRKVPEGSVPLGRPPKEK